MQNIRIYHNPRCSKSRETLALIREQGFKPEVIEYLATPPSAKELDQILSALSLEPQDIVRTKEAIYKDLGLSKKNMSRSEWIQILIDHPVLIERPIVISGKKAALGRPPEAVLSILKSL